MLSGRFWSALTPLTSTVTGLDVLVTTTGDPMSTKLVPFVLKANWLLAPGLAK
jgi:hypothetical protein